MNYIHSKVSDLLNGVLCIFDINLNCVSIGVVPTSSEHYVFYPVFPILSQHFPNYLQLIQNAFLSPTF